MRVVPGFATAILALTLSRAVLGALYVRYPLD